MHYNVNIMPISAELKAIIKGGTRNRNIPYSANELLGQQNIPNSLKNFKRALEKYYKNDGRSQLDTSEKRNNIVILFLAMQEKERSYPNTFQLVHGQDSFFFAYQVIAKTLYELKTREHLSKFKFFRYPTDSLMKTPAEFFTKFPDLLLTQNECSMVLNAQNKPEESGEETEKNDDDENEQSRRNDTFADISEQLLSVNFTLETYVTLDSTLFAFLTGKGVTLSNYSDGNDEYHNKLKNILENIFQNANIKRSSYEPYLETLIENSPKTSTCIITQIFIPKDQIKKHLYMSFPGGFSRPDRDEHMEEFLNTFQKRREANFNVKDNVQGRLIAGSLFTPNIKMYRYTLIPKTERDAYKKFVLTILKDILKKEQTIGNDLETQSITQQVSVSNTHQ